MLFPRQRQPQVHLVSNAQLITWVCTILAIQRHTRAFFCDTRKTSQLVAGLVLCKVRKAYIVTNSDYESRKRRERKHTTIFGIWMYMLPFLTLYQTGDCCRRRNDFKIQYLAHQIRYFGHADTSWRDETRSFRDQRSHLHKTRLLYTSIQQWCNEDHTVTDWPREIAVRAYTIRFQPSFRAM